MHGDNPAALRVEASEILILRYDDLAIKGAVCRDLVADVVARFVILNAAPVLVLHCKTGARICFVRLAALRFGIALERFLETDLFLPQVKRGLVAVMAGCRSNIRRSYALQSIGREGISNLCPFLDAARLVLVHLPFRCCHSTLLWRFPPGRCDMIFSVIGMEYPLAVS